MRTGATSLTKNSKTTDMLRKDLRIEQIIFALHHIEAGKKLADGPAISTRGSVFFCWREYGPVGGKVAAALRDGVCAC